MSEPGAGVQQAYAEGAHEGGTGFAGRHDQPRCIAQDLRREAHAGIGRAENSVVPARQGETLTT